MSRPNPTAFRFPARQPQTPSYPPPPFPANPITTTDTPQTPRPLPDGRYPMPARQPDSRPQRWDAQPNHPRSTPPSQYRSYNAQPRRQHGGYDTDSRRQSHDVSHRPHGVNTLHNDLPPLQPTCYRHLDGSLRPADHIPPDPEYCVKALPRGSAMVVHTSNLSPTTPFHPDSYLPGPGHLFPEANIDQSFVAITFVTTTAVMHPSETDNFATALSDFAESWIKDMAPEVQLRQKVEEAVANRMAPVLQELQKVASSLAGQAKDISSIKATRGNPAGSGDSRPPAAPAVVRGIDSSGPPQAPPPPPLHSVRPYSPGVRPSKRPRAAPTSPARAPSTIVLSDSTDPVVFISPPASPTTGRPTPDDSPSRRSSRSHRSSASIAREAWMSDHVGRHLETHLRLSSSTRPFIKKLFKFINHPKSNPDRPGMQVSELRQKAHPILVRLLLAEIAKNPLASLPMQDAVRAYKETSK